MLNMVVVGADLVAAELALKATTWPTTEASIVAHWGAVYQTRVRAAASGRPGPRVISGDYRRRISLEVRRTASGAVAIVGTDHPGGRRLELGFVGVDSAGRHVQAPPYSHFGPPLERTVDEMANSLSLAVA